MATSKTSTTVDTWSGDFGGEYMRRNPVSAEATTQAEQAFGRMLSGVSDVRSVLEVGANVGINLSALRRLLPKAHLSAVEPNPAARATLLATKRADEVHEATAYALPFPDNTFDLAFTNGVLIHVPPDRLADAVKEIARVSKRLVLCSEYFSHKPVEITYHGRDDLLWKRDFGAFYLESVPSLRTRTYGFLWQNELPLFDNLNWWLFEKSR